MFRIALINMPFGGLHIPSLALTQLKAVIDRQFSGRVSVDVLYLNHDFKQTFGLDLYRYLSDNGVTTVTGLTDWIFRKAAFPNLPDNAEEYLSRYQASFRLGQEHIDHIISQRAGIDDYLDGLIDKYDLESYQLIGFTSMFDQMVASFAMARKIKERAPGITTIIGGASCELSTGTIIAKRIKAIDFVFSGPALKSFPQFVQHILDNDLEKCHHVQGVFSRQNITEVLGQRNRLMGEETDINMRLPLDYDSFLHSLTEKCPELEPQLFFETSRGCWWGEKAHCTFCGLNGITMNYRTMSAQNAIAQFNELFEKYPRVPLFFAVDNILAQDYFDTVLPYIKVPKHSNVFYETKLITNEQHMKVLADAGVTNIQPGIEALSTSVLKIMRKGTTAFQNISFLKSALKYNIMPDWNLLIGFPNESEEVYRKYVDDIPSLVHLPPPGATFPVRFDRYSPYHSKPEEYKLDLRPLDFYALIYPFPKEELNEYAYFFADHNYENGYMLNLSRWRRKVEASVDHWLKRWNQQDGKLKPSLRFIGDNVIYDSRSGEATEYEIADLGVQALKHLSKPMGVSALKHQLKADGELDRQLAILKEHKLVFQEGESMLSLVN